MPTHTHTNTHTQTCIHTQTLEIPHPSSTKCRGLPALQTLPEPNNDESRGQPVLTPDPSLIVPTLLTHLLASPNIKSNPYAPDASNKKRSLSIDTKSRFS